MNGKPHSKRSGPSGENQRMPKPVDVRRYDKLSGKLKQGLTTFANCGAGVVLQNCCSVFHALPASKNVTPRIPTLSRIGNSNSRFMYACRLPPMFAPFGIGGAFTSSD